MMGGVRKLGKVLLWIVGAVVALALIVLVVRGINGWRYPQPALRRENPADLSTYSGRPGVGVTHVTGTYLNGFHLKPDRVTHRGVVVTFGGSDGGCNWDLANRLADQGYEVLALFFFGQENQRPTLDKVPLEFFGEVLQYVDAHASSAAPVTVVGVSKGGELVSLLPTYYPRIDNVVAYSPGEYVYQGLDYAAPGSSWTWQGRELPYVRFQYSSPQGLADMMVPRLLNTPMRLRTTYETSTARDPDAAAARIDITTLRGHLLTFAGSDDQMWQGDVAAVDLARAKGALGEAHVYPGAGHLFGLPGDHVGGFLMGGTKEANLAAFEDSNRVLAARLADWHR